MIASWMSMSRDIDLVSNASAKRGVDVVISALDLGRDAGLLPAIVGDMPYRAARLIIVGPPPDDERLVDAAANGAWAYCSLNSPPQELTATVRRVHAGECPLLAEISRRTGAAQTTLALLTGGGSTSALLNRLPSPLTEREKDILTAVSDGATSREIAEKLGLMDQTIRNYMTTLLRKIGARTRGQAAALALRNGWLDI
jgi:DNA-binding NarL/FixJ family response regulator